jgi:hypothetical protein
MSLDLKTALSILKEYSCLQIKPVTSEAEKVQLTEALLLVIGESDSENIGICAENSQQGFQVLSSYLKHLGYDSNFQFNDPNLNRPIYLKFNSQRMSTFMDNYDGEYRGVLISCQSENDHVSGTYGYFPLDLFLE